MNNSFVVEMGESGVRLDSFLCNKLGDYTRSHIKILIDESKVLLNDKHVKSGEKVKVGDVITVLMEEPKKLEVSPQNIKIEIVYEDDDLAVINKPKGMVVHPANGNDDGTLVNALLFHLENLSGINGVIRPGIVHRLDKDTSGLLLVAKNDKSHVHLAKQIEEKSCHRYYKALCYGNFKNDSGIIETGFGRNPKDRKQMAVFRLGEGKRALTKYNVLKRFGNYTFVEFVLETGRTHQIRVHSKYIGHTIIGDEVYGKKDKNFKTTGQLLHAYKIEFTQPTTNERLVFESDLPEEFMNALNKLKNK